MQKSSLSLVLLALICGSLGWWTGRQQTAAERVDVRRELLDEISVNRSLREECFNNLRNQFTPGFRFAQVLPDPHDVTLSMTQGQIFKTGVPLDLAVHGGKGFFMLSYEDEVLYTRDGRFRLRNDALQAADEKGTVLGYKVDEKGVADQTLRPIEIVLEPSTKLYDGRFTDLHVDEEGTLYGTHYELGEDVPLYRVALTSFVSPERLERAGTTLLRQTSQARLFRQGVAGQWDFGQICPGSLELANVDVTQQTYVIGALRLHAGLLGETPPPVPTAASPPPVAPNGWPVSPHPALPPSMMNINPYATGLNPSSLFSR